MNNAIITAVAAYFTFTCKITGKEKRGRRISASLTFQGPAVTNTGKWKVTTWQGSGKYTIHAIGHKPGRVWDCKNPSPGSTWMVADTDYTTVDQKQGALPMLSWLRLFCSEEQAWSLFSQLESAQVVKVEQSESSSDHTPVKPIPCGWASTNELCRI